MEFKSKFEINDYVHQITQDKDWISVVCPTCDGEGLVTLKKKEFGCPDCHGKGNWRESIDRGWRVGISGTVGRIRIDLVIPKKVKNFRAKYLEEYMLYETGVPSGQVYNGDNLFGSVGEAQRECEKRNREEAKKNVSK